MVFCLVTTWQTTFHKLIRWFGPTTAAVFDECHVTHGFGSFGACDLGECVFNFEFRLIGSISRCGWEKYDRNIFINIVIVIVSILDNQFFEHK